MRYHITGLSLALHEGEAQIKAVTAKRLGITPSDWIGFRIVRRSLDARRSRPPHYVYQVEIEVPDKVKVATGTVRGVTVAEAPESASPIIWVSRKKPDDRPVVVGSGPAGLFAALTLSLQGIPVLLLERGGDVIRRIDAVNRFWEKGILDPECNVQFGEGGAGTFSDGKLTSRSRNPLTGWVKKVLVEMGALPEILVDAKPHIGTDRLKKIMLNLRKRLKDLGCEIRFGAALTGLQTHRGRLAGIIVNSKEQIKVRHLVLAPGQSADDTYRMLRANGLILEPKPFAVGFRVEHPQALINHIQYGSWGKHPMLPPAEYVLTAQIPNLDRGVYSFCMCPGGRVIGSSADAGRIVTNGMSGSRRDDFFANSAIVVTVRPEDFADGTDNPLAGLSFRQRWEAEAFVQGGKDYRAPAQGLQDFMTAREGALPSETSYLPGVRPAVLRKVMPFFVTEALREGCALFGRKMPGFVCKEAVLIGVETRTSSPVRIRRNEEGQSPGLEGVYPCGEGAGYAGGIISSALDGIGAAESIRQTIG